jgi:hypothetical protein
VGLKCLPNGLTSRYLHICINEEIPDNAQQGGLASGVIMFKCTLLISGLYTSRPFLHHIKAAHRGQPQNSFLAPSLIVSALKRRRFQQTRKANR